MNLVCGLLALASECERLDYHSRGAGYPRAPETMHPAYGPWQPVSWSLLYVVYGLMIICVEYVGGSFGS
jgi:hypothetical protein